MPPAKGERSGPWTHEPPALAGLAGLAGAPEQPPRPTTTTSRPATRAAPRSTVNTTHLSCQAV